VFKFPPDSKEPAGDRRLLKRVLRFLPRRAVLHRYPFIGRFAASLRPRAYLWSLRRPAVRRAYYAGAVLAFLPLMGIQLPLALLAAIALRCNFMILGGLQLITNPLTAGPVYYLTHELGAAVLNQLASPSGPPIMGEAELVVLGGSIHQAIGEPLASNPESPRWTTRARTALVSMAVGGVIVGLSVGVVLDVLDKLARSRRPTQIPRPVASRSELR
jgi:uncharacterized protein (DUF2062 family)